MSRNQYLSTGEAARILNISRSTVSRRFDAGQLEGKLNPITGERLIARKSVEETIKKHNLSVEIPFSGIKHVIVCAVDTELSNRIESLIGEDRRIRTTTSQQGADVLMDCARNVPDLLIVEDPLPDLRGPHVIKSLRRHIDTADMKIIYCEKGLSSSKATVTGWGVDNCIDTQIEEDRRSLKKVIYGLLGLSPEVAHPKAAHEHKRRWPRFPVDLEATLTAIPIGHPDRTIGGRAKITDISGGGACLTDIAMENASFPGEPFRMMLSVDQHPLKEWKAKCEVVRLQASDTMSAGVQFADISPEDREKISGLQVA